MNRFIYCAIIILFCFSCGKKRRDITFAQDQNTSFFEYFGNDTTFVGKKGTRISIKKESIDLLNFKSVEIEFKEYYSLYDFFISGISTLSSDGLLSSEGFFEIKCVDNDIIKINPDYPIQIFTNRYRAAEESVVKQYILNRDVWYLNADSILNEDIKISHFTSIEGFDSVYVEVSGYIFNINSFGWHNADYQVDSLFSSLLINTNSDGENICSLFFQG